MTTFRALILCSLLVLTLPGCNRTPYVDRAGAPPSSTPEQTAVSSSSDVVRVTAAQMTLARNGPRAEAVVTLTITPGFHVNANPATFSYLIATELKLETRAGITAGTPLYPAGEKKKFQFADEPLAVYEGEVKIRLPLNAGADAKTGLQHLPMNLVVQACDQEKCYSPVAMDATVAIDIK
jgi:hypothetical protein